MDKSLIFSTIKTVVKNTLPWVDENGIVIEASLRDFGANSIDRIDIIMQTMEEIGVQVPMVQFAHAKNIQNIVDLLHESANGR